MAVRGEVDVVELAPLFIGQVDVILDKSFKKMGRNECLFDEHLSSVLSLEMLLSFMVFPISGDGAGLRGVGGCTQDWSNSGCGLRSVLSLHGLMMLVGPGPPCSM